MRLAKEIDGKIEVKNYRAIVEHNVLCGLENLTDDELNGYGYYRVVTPDYDSLLEYLGEWKVDKKIVTADVIDKGLDIEVIRAEKIKEVTRFYDNKTAGIMGYHKMQQFDNPDYVIPQDIVDDAIEYETTKAKKVAELEALNDIKDVIIYE